MGQSREYLGSDFIFLASVRFKIRQWLLTK